MDRNDPSELISAYLDGELTPQERAEAERLLDATPKLREELNDFARMSDLLRAVPKETAPAGLSQSVRQQAGQRALWPVASAAPARSLRREIVAALSGIAVTAAAWLITVQSLEFSGSRPTASPVSSAMTAKDSAPVVEPMPELAMTSPPASSMLRDKRSATEGESLAHAPPAPVAGKELKLHPQPSVMTSDGAAKPHAVHRAADGVAAPLAGKSMRQEDGLEGSFAGGGGLGAAHANGLMSESAVWDTVRIGDVLPYLERSNDGVAVVELTVVDIQEAGGQMAYLLTQNGLQVIPDSSAAANADRDQDKQQAAAESGKGAMRTNENHLMVVYVDAPREKLAQFLEEMVQDRVFTHARLQPPVDGPPLAWNSSGGPADGPQAGSDGTGLVDAERALVEEAAELSRSYNDRRLASNVKSGEQAANQNTFRKMGGNQAGSEEDVTRRNLVRGQSVNAQRRAALQSPVDTRPADAMQAANSMSQNSPAIYRLQNAATLLEFDAETGEIADSAANLPAAAAAPGQIVAKSGVQLAEKAKANRETRSGVKDDGKPGQAGQNEAAEPSIRVLFVLQQAEPDPAPQD